ncbi:MAG: hypothetical protein JWP97_670 [Labilithrix sp.]|nr:hypothetical protein [Labilithrix sp.]
MARLFQPVPTPKPPERAEALVRTLCGIPEAALRAAYMRDLLLRTDVSALAPVLDTLSARAEQAEGPAREALVAIVDALNHVSCVAVVQRLREEASAVPHLALERLVRKPVSIVPARDVGKPEDDRVPDYGKGRPLTLGERKSLARKPDRATMDRLLRDPHPDVIRMVLAGPKVTEDDVLAVAARRPCRPDVLTEIARQPRWVHRPRIRMALVMNPDTPLEMAAPIVGLLMRHELRLVTTSPAVPAGVRALCHEHLERRPPGEFDDEPDDAKRLQ